MEANDIERVADELCDHFDEAYFEFMNRILDQVRGETNNPQTIHRNLGHLAIEAPENPKTT